MDHMEKYKRLDYKFQGYISKVNKDKCFYDSEIEDMFSKIELFESILKELWNKIKIQRTLVVKVKSASKNVKQDFSHWNGTNYRT